VQIDEIKRVPINVQKKFQFSPDKYSLIGKNIKFYILHQMFEFEIIHLFILNGEILIIILLDKKSSN
jgi:hypothetical protein